MTFAELDKASEGDREARLKKSQPAIYDYISANVESDEMKRTVLLMALAMDYVF